MHWGGGVHSLLGLLIHWGGVYTPSMDYLCTGKDCTLPPWFFYPLGRAVHSLRGLFIYWGGVYTPSVDYLSDGEGCTLPP